MRIVFVLLTLICSASAALADAINFSYQAGVYNLNAEPYQSTSINSWPPPPFSLPGVPPYTPPPWSGGSPTYNPLVTASNNVGQFVGTFNCQCAGTSHGFFFDGSAYSMFDYGSHWTIPSGINDAGQIIGYYDTGLGYFSGFVFDGQFTAIADPNGSQLIPEYINRAGQIVGHYRGMGFLFDNGVLYDIKPLGLPPGLMQITGIDEDGTVFGVYQTYAVPEPSTWAMLLIGFAGVGFAAHRRRRYQKPQYVR